MLIQFFYTLRAAKLPVSVKEYLTLLEALQAGVLDDDGGPTVDKFYTLSRAALALYEATGDGGYLAQAEAWVAEVEKRYGDKQAGGYFFAAKKRAALVMPSCVEARKTWSPSSILVLPRGTTNSSPACR